MELNYLCELGVEISSAYCLYLRLHDEGYLMLSVQFNKLQTVA